MDDYIKRQDVLDAIWLVDPQNDGSDGGTVVLQNLELTSADVESIVSEIPAADVRPVVRGRWIEKPYLLGICSAQRTSVLYAVKITVGRTGNIISVPTAGRI